MTQVEAEQEEEDEEEEALSQLDSISLCPLTSAVIMIPINPIQSSASDETEWYLCPADTL